MPAIKDTLQAFQKQMNEKADYNSIIFSSKEALCDNEKVETGKLKGKTIAVKDNIAVKGWPLTCTSNILKDYTSPYNATVVERILSEGGVVVGKTNHDEFAMGSSNEHSVFGHAKNPVDSELVPGGSSGGSAISVALGLTDMALGSDTGGSIRQPAAFCGVYGLKPTYGRVSRYGLVAFASSFDQIGPFANTTHDLALLTEVISGVDQNETTSVDKEVPPFVESLGSDVPKNIGVPWSILEKGVEPEILDRLKSLTGFLEGKGFDIISIDLPNLKYNIAVYYILTMAEASSNLARYDGVRYGLSERDDSLEEMYKDTRSSGFGEEVKRRIMLGTYVLSSGYYDAYYRKAQQMRRLIQCDFINSFNEVDVILSPTTPTLPFKLGENLDDPLKMYLSDIFTTPINLAGIPAINIPVGKSSSDLPIGLQLIGNFFSEETILNLSHYIEQNFSV
tara:strand:- start:16506 stop:17855 length:1350 start_codon:yes stop_codon:yes gene_type:complete